MNVSFHFYIRNVTLCYFIVSFNTLVIITKPCLISSALCLIIIRSPVFSVIYATVWSNILELVTRCDEETLATSWYVGITITVTCQVCEATKRVPLTGVWPSAAVGLGFTRTRFTNTGYLASSEVSLHSGSWREMVKHRNHKRIPRKSELVTRLCRKIESLRELLRSIIFGRINFSSFSVRRAADILDLGGKCMCLFLANYVI